MRNLGLLITLTWLAVATAQAQGRVPVDEAKLSQCLSMSIGKDRWACYREALSLIRPSALSYSTEAVDRCTDGSLEGEKELVCLDELFHHPQPGSGLD